ncbi:MAG: ROK family protein [Candidatus Pacearchaeota archaeon]|nr:ROK family protein [Candidatus Pacearchaeota archaeon]
MGKKIGVDLGGTFLRVGIVENNRVVKYIKKQTPKTEKELVNEMAKSISECMTSDVTGIGVASPGPLKDGIIYDTPNLPFTHFNMKQFLQRKFKKRVEIKNDAHCVALAEAKLGCKKKNFLVVTLGTGIDIQGFSDGKLYEGQGYAGELGHLVLDDGKYWEILWQENKKKTQACCSGKFMIKDMFHKKNKEAAEILRSTTRYLGQGIGSLINAFDPEVVILMGGVREAGSKFLKMISREAKNYTILPRIPPIRWSRLDHPGILGASLLIS